jgi:hypothetical protein
LSKKQRINAGLLQIKANNLENLDGLENLFDYFALNVQQGEENIIVRDKPAYCRDITQKTQKKPACVDCESVCSFTIEDILSKTNGIGQNDIYAELSAHFHPRSRLILIANGASRQRSTQEAARELADHYIYSHNLTEPSII